MAGEQVLVMKDITKEFDGIRVLNRVNLEVRSGEIHGLVGENGAGKSTLMNILFGMPLIEATGGFKGEVFLNGKEVRIGAPFEAMALGIGMVHQEFMLLPGFTVTENVKLNREITKPNLISRLAGKRLESLDLEKMGEDAKRALDTIGISIEEWATVAGLPVGYMQFVEIAREIDKENATLLVFDEPTAVLTESEAEHLLQAVRRLAKAGIAIVFISHRLDEVLAVADRITVLRDGEVVSLLDRSEASLEKLAALMVGRKIEKISLPPRRQEPRARDIILRIENLEVDMPGERVRGLNLEVRRGEILGIGGLAGQGKLGLANGIMGLYPARGRVVKDGRKIPLNNAIEALKSGLAFVSEDRRGVGLLMDEPLELNLTLTAIQVYNKFLKSGKGLDFFSFIDKKAIRDYATKTIKQLDIRCRGSEQLVRTLSGGNQQKVCVGRAVALEPEVLFVSEPTRGIDVGAKKILLDMLVQFNREKNMTIVMTSSELAELRKICDRIVIICEGKLMGILAPDAPDVEFGLLMAGRKSKEI